MRSSQSSAAPAGERVTILCPQSRKLHTKERGGGLTPGTEKKKKHFRKRKICINLLHSLSNWTFWRGLGTPPGYRVSRPQGPQREGRQATTTTRH